MSVCITLSCLATYPNKDVVSAGNTGNASTKTKPWLVTSTSTAVPEMIGNRWGFTALTLDAAVDRVGSPQVRDGARKRFNLGRLSALEARCFACGGQPKPNHDRTSLTQTGIFWDRMAPLRPNFVVFRCEKSRLSTCWRGLTRGGSKAVGERWLVTVRPAND
jgi:hypothetical protein